MDDQTEQLILGEGATTVPSHPSSVDPHTEASLRAWNQLRRAVRRDVDRAAGDRHLIVLYALDRCGEGGGLDAGERARLDDARDRIEKALEETPFLRDVVSRIESDALMFKRAWEGEPTAERAAVSRQRSALAPVRRLERAWRWRAAGLVAAAVLVGVAALLSLDRTRLVVVEAPAGGARDVRLADGSTVRLMSGSKLSYRAEGTGGAFDRTVRLDGSGFFVVAHDPEAPFTVETADVTTTVLGTHFGIVRQADSTDVVLASGSVQVNATDDPGRAVTLVPGTMSRVVRGGGVSEPVPVDVVEALGWTGLFVFRGETYRRIAEHLSKHYQVAIQVAPELAEQRQSGTFERSLGLEEILHTIERSWGFRVDGDASMGYTLRPVP